MAPPRLLISEIKLGAYNGLHLAVRSLAVGIPAITIGDSTFSSDAEQLGDRHEGSGFGDALLVAAIEGEEQRGRRGLAVRDQLAGQIGPVDEARGERVDDVAPPVGREVAAGHLEHPRGVAAEEVVGHELYGKVAKAGLRPRGTALYPMEMPFVESIEEAQHFRLGPEVYADAPSPYREPISSPARDAVEAGLPVPLAVPAASDPTAEEK